MSLVESRYAIVESISAMDGFQTKMVLDYINDLKEKEAERQSYFKFREEAMKEIDNALKEIVS